MSVGSNVWLSQLEADFNKATRNSNRSKKGQKVTPKHTHVSFRHNPKAKKFELYGNDASKGAA